VSQILEVQTDVNMNNQISKSMKQIGDRIRGLSGSRYLSGRVAQALKVTFVMANFIQLSEHSTNGNTVSVIHLMQCATIAYTLRNLSLTLLTLILSLSKLV
jgi:hypothetical protein